MPRIANGGAPCLFLLLLGPAPWLLRFQHAVEQGLELRQFLLRGLEKVRTEWLWACTAFNMRKMIRAMAILRTEMPRARAEQRTSTAVPPRRVNQQAL